MEDCFWQISYWHVFISSSNVHNEIVVEILWLNIFTTNARNREGINRIHKTFLLGIKMNFFTHNHMTPQYFPGIQITWMPSLFYQKSANTSLPGILFVFNIFSAMSMLWITLSLTCREIQLSHGELDVNYVWHVPTALCKSFLYWHAIVLQLYTVHGPARM